ncbi:MAG: Ig-like domain-containing protein [Ignavibacteriales bacterium]|nr:Ig-like domain-containing protein [Ignavibacteriales bacterium]
MNTPTTNRTTSFSQPVRFSRMSRGVLGVALSAGLTAALFFGAMMAGCNDHDEGIVGACDNTPPIVSLVLPNCGATGVALNQKINATFSESIDSSTVTMTTFTLAGPSATPVSGTVTYVSATNIATFTPAGSLAASTTYTYTIRGGTNGVKDVMGNALANNFGCSFTTGPAPDITPPTVISTNPANNATGVSLSKVTPSSSAHSGPVAKLNKTSSTAAGKIITATFSEAMDPLTITTSTFTVTGPGVTPVTGLVTYAGPTFTATFVAANTLAPNTTYTGTITTGAKDLAGNTLVSNYVWTFTTGAAPDITPPTVISADPVNNATGVALNKKIAATFSESMNQSTLNATTFTLKQGTTPVLGTVTNTSTTALFTPSSSLAANTVYTATISTGAMDTTGNALASNYVWNFTTGAVADVTPPTVISTDPANNATGVAINKKIAATFSEAMDPLTITTGFTLRQGTTPVSGTVTYAGTTAIFAPASNLAVNTVYTATISTGTKDLAGNALASNYVWSFTTAAAADVIPPTVLSTDPGNNATGVALNKIISAIFSEAMDQSTISTATVTLTGLGGASVTGTVGYANGANTVTFTPASALATNTTYTGTIKGGLTGAKDLAGNALVSNYVWTFTTAATADITPPTVIFTDPVNNATGVALNKKIAATFSEAMNQSTISATTFTLKQGITPVLGTVTNTSTTALFTPSSSLAANTVYTATISTGAMDTTGNALASNYVWNFTTGAVADVTPPTVISTDPANNATGVALNKKVAATFSESMDPLTVTTTTFTLRQGATPVSGSVIYAGAAAEFTPASPLAANTVYTATISTGAKDLAGNALASNYVWSFTTAAAADVIPPTVISTDPTNNATGVALNKIITAVFSEAMGQSTISTATVSLTGLGGASVTGTVSYASGANTVTFTPASALAANTTYTGTIKGGLTGAKDLAGNALVNNYVWSFTTGAGTGPAGQASVNLGTAARFAILSNSAITNIPTSAITGDVGISPGARASITGLTLPEVTGTIFAADDAIPTPAMLIAAKADALAAYLDAVAASRGTPTPVSGNINGLTLAPGLYQSGTSIEISPGGFLYLDAQGDVNAVFVIRSATSITTQSTSEVVLTNGAQAANVYWSAGSAVTLGTNSKMKGTIIASTSISLLTGARLDGRALIQGPAAGQVSLDHSIIIKP